MKRLIHNWWVGFQLLVRLLIALLCMTGGLGALLGLQAGLGAVHISMPYYFFLFLQVVYFVVICPLFIASYARYCGFTSNTRERQHDAA
jgi:hypothetical protein